MKTNINLLQNTSKYRKTLKWVITNIYNHNKVRSKNKSLHLWYSLKEFQEFCFNNSKFIELYEFWKNNWCKTYLKPSIDRIDCLKWYVFENIQVMTAWENRSKWDKEKEIIWWKPIIQFDIFWNKIKEFPSIKQAVKETWLWQSGISLCLLWKRNHTWWFKWSYQNPELLNNN